MSGLCSFLSQHLEPVTVTYLNEIDEEDEYEEIDYETSLPDYTFGTNDNERRITLPQPNGEISKPLKLDLGQVSLFIYLFLNIFQNSVLRKN